MRLQKLRVQNWCQHRQREIAFGGVTVLRGPVGAGKTTLMSALTWVLTGETASHVKDEENRCQLAGEREPCGVWLDLEAGGQPVSIQRSLKPVKRSLTLGGKSFTKDKEVRAELEKLLGVSRQILLDYMFVPQWQMFAFLSQGDADRDKALGELFGLAHAEKAWKAMGEVKVARPLDPADDADFKIDFQAELLVADNEMAEAKKMLDNAAAEMEFLADSANERAELLRIAETRKSFIESINKTIQTSAMVLNDIESVGADRLGEVARTKKIKERLESCGDEYNSAAEARESWPKYQVWSAAHARASSGRRAAEKTVENLLAAYEAPPDGYVEHLSEAIKLRDVTSVRITEMERLLASCDPEQGAAECPTCGTQTTIGTLADRITAAREALPGLKEEYSSLKKRIDVSLAYMEKEATRQKQLKIEQDLLRVFDAELLSVGTMTAPSMTAKQADQAVELWRGQVFQLQEAERRVTLLDNRLHELRVRQQSLNDQMAPIKEKLSSLPPVDEGRLKELEIACQRLTAVSAIVTVSKVKLASAQQQRAALEKRRLRIEKMKVQYSRSSGLIDELEMSRSLLHRENLPRQTTLNWLLYLKDKVNANLEDMDLEFRVTGLDGSNFMVTFSDGEYAGITVTAQRLSGGQKVLFALAFRLAVNWAFAADLGLLCLDEPTAGLDAASLLKVRIALEKLCSPGRDQSLQIVLITHESRLDGIGDCVIDLTT
jgi:DNA repair exonuclease SbcCD ATPase subunit